MMLVTDLVLGLLALAGSLTILRLLRGPSLADRIVALDATLVVLVCGIAVMSVRRGSGLLLDVLVVAALLGFTSTSLVARFIERRGA